MYSQPSVELAFVRKAQERLIQGHQGKGRQHRRLSSLFDAIGGAELDSPSEVLLLLLLLSPL